MDSPKRPRGVATFGGFFDKKNQFRHSGCTVTDLIWTGKSDVTKFAETEWRTAGAGPRSGRDSGW